ncbi:hypothetical protein FVE85_5002 [Porphyridium purpureum]|uniref:Transmembrane protein n=1 Tax=Porphyridium purpureum TaxID=35688 RepID=A0A5J4YRH1_PORPP|nr:hypothetical protein FVE85_5002 [Porphyridium purpureum]|eukprot:POR2760..scf236_6
MENVSLPGDRLIMAVSSKTDAHVQAWLMQPQVQAFLAQLCAYAYGVALMVWLVQDGQRVGEMLNGTRGHSQLAHKLRFWFCAALLVLCVEMIDVEQALAAGAFVYAPILALLGLLRYSAIALHRASVQVETLVLCFEPDIKALLAQLKAHYALLRQACHEMSIQALMFLATSTMDAAQDAQRSAQQLNVLTTVLQQSDPLDELEHEVAPSASGIVARDQRDGQTENNSDGKAHRGRVHAAQHAPASGTGGREGERGLANTPVLASPPRFFTGGLGLQRARSASDARALRGKSQVFLSCDARLQTVTSSKSRLDHSTTATARRESAASLRSIRGALEREMVHAGDFDTRQSHSSGSSSRLPTSRKYERIRALRAELLQASRLRGQEHQRAHANPRELSFSSQL